MHQRMLQMHCMLVLLIELQKLLKKDKENNYGFIFYNNRLIK